MPLANDIRPKNLDEFFGQKTEYEINKYAENNIGNWKSSLEKGGR